MSNSTIGQSIAKALDILAGRFGFGTESIVLRLFPFDITLRKKQEENFDERIAKLSRIQADLEQAQFAVADIIKLTTDKNQELLELKDAVKGLSEEKNLLEKGIDPFDRRIRNAVNDGRLFGFVVGILSGLLTGIASTIIVNNWSKIWGFISSLFPQGTA